MKDKWVIIKYANNVEPVVDIFTTEESYLNEVKELKREREELDIHRGRVIFAKVIEDVEENK